MQELKMFVYHQTIVNIITDTFGVVTPEFNKYAEIAARAILTSRTDHPYTGPVYLLCAAIMLTDEEPDSVNTRAEVNYDNYRLGLAVVEEADPRSPLLPDQDLWQDGVRLLQSIEFDERSTQEENHGPAHPGTGIPLWVGGESDLSVPVHPDWGNGFRLLRIIEQDIEMQMPIEELARKGLVAAGIAAPPNSVALILEEGKPPVAWVINEKAEATEIDAREVIAELIKGKGNSDCDYGE